MIHHIDDGTTRYDSGELSAEQADALRPHVIGRYVHDLGAGNGRMAACMVQLGASHVLAIDAAYGQTRTAGRLTIMGAYLHEYTPAEPIELALVSWPPWLFAPPEVRQGLPRLLERASVVAYLGSNFGHVCGNWELWRHVGTREVLTHVPDPRNTLIVYGRQGGRVPGQGLLPEEKAALYREVTPHPVYGVTYAD